MTTIFVSLRALSAALLITPGTSTEMSAGAAIQLSIHGVRIEAAMSETRIVATDRKSLVLLREDAPNFMEPHVRTAFTIPLDVVHTLLTRQPDELGDLVSIDATPDTWVLQCGNLTLQFVAVAGDFLDYRQALVAPDTRTGAPATFSAAVLDGIALAAGVFCNQEDGSQQLRLHQSGPTGAIVVQCPNPDFYGLIMPLAEDTANHPVDWVFAPAKS
jgi:hypothetical protein